MRHWILCSAFLISTQFLQACGGWYPFGEEVRFSLLHPQLYDDGGMYPFYYSADYVNGLYEHSWQNDRNVDDWYNFTKGAVSKEDVFDAVYRLTSAEISDPNSKHPFVQQLLKQGNTSELDYLSFAKRYSYLNSRSEDPWERDEVRIFKKRTTAIRKAMCFIEDSQDDVMKRRYAFQALRFAYYNQQPSVVGTIYQQYFSGHDELIIDKWAYYFYLHFVGSATERNFELAQLFPDIPSKRFGIFSLFDWDVHKSEVLKYARTDEERANVIAMYAIRRQDPALSDLKQIMELYPGNPLIQFLIVRELNKVEDWVLGPTYTTFAPVLRPGLDRYSEDQELIRSAVEEDRYYAKKYLTWLVTHEEDIDVELYLSVKASLEFCTGDSAAAMVTLKGAVFENSEREVWRQRMFDMLEVANGGDVEGIDMDLFLANSHVHKDRFVFMLGRLFEYRGELGKALLLFAQLNEDREDWTWFTWAEPKGYTKYNISFYYDYFDYFDANYTATELGEALGYVQSLRANNSEKKIQSLTEFIIGDENRLNDLVGTKFFRQDDLPQALVWLKKVPEDYWKSRDQHYAHYLAANPFYANFYSAHAKTEGDTVHYTKYEITKKLHHMLESIGEQNGNEQAHTMYHIANCYFNMTTHGNSWMMRRSWWSSYVVNTIYIDDEEYTKCLKAHEYYMKAYRATSSDKFKALCLRMAGRCEGIKLREEIEYDYEYDYEKVGGYDEYLFDKNSAYARLKKEFPQYERELISNCYSFNRFYRSI